MPLLGTVLFKVGSTITQIAGKVLLQQKRARLEREMPLAGIATSHVLGVLPQNQKKQFEQLSRDIAERLESFISIEFPSLQQNEKIAALDGVVCVLNNADLTDSLVLAADVNTGKLATAILPTAKQVERTLSLSEPGVEFFRLILRQALAYLIAFISSLPSFQGRALVESLERESHIIDLLTETLNRLTPTATKRNATEAYRAFEDMGYRQQIIDQYEYLEFAGMPLDVIAQEGSPVTVPLDRVYMRLRAMTGQATRRQSRLTDAPSSREASRRRARTYIEKEQKKSRGLAEHARQSDIVEPGAAIRNNRHVVIEGVAGSGKSTMLKALARSHASDPTQPLPLYVSLKLFDLSMTNSLTPMEALMRFLAWPPDSQEYVAAAIKKAEQPNSKGVRFLFDGLDEVQHHRPQITTLIRQLRVSHSIVVATRHEGREPFSNFQYYTVLPLLRTDSERFAARWLEIIAEVKGVQESERFMWVAQRSHWLRDQLDDRPHLRDVALNPLMLTFLTLIARDPPTDGLPRFRKELYARYIETLFTSWEARRQNRGEVLTIGDYRQGEAHEVAVHVLYETALLLQNGYYGDETMPRPTESELIHALAAVLAESWQLPISKAKGLARDVLEFWSEAGLIRKFDYDGQDWYLFRHQSFQEYGAARALAEKSTKSGSLWLSLEPLLFKAGWTDVVPLTLACAQDLPGATDNTHYTVESIDRLLHPDGRTDRENRLARNLAARCIAEGVEVPEQLRAELVDDLVHTALTRGDHDYGDDGAAQAFRAIVSLGWSYFSDVMPKLKSLLEVETTPWRRVRIAETMAKIGDVISAIRVLREIALNPTVDREWRLVAAWSMGRFGFTKEAAAVLQQLGRNLRDELDVVKILIELGEEDLVIDLLMKIATGSLYSSWDRIKACDLLLERNERPLALQWLSQLANASDLPDIDKMYAAVRLAAAQEGNR